MKKHVNIIFKSIFITALSLILPAIILAILTLDSAQNTFAQQARETEQAYEKDKEPPPAFGYDIFRALPEPITEGPMDEQYLLSPGDEVIITVWGQLNLKYPLTVSEDGYIEIPDEGGRVFTNGVSLKELRRLVTERLSRIYSSYINAANPSASTAFVDVKLGKVRKLLVYVVGEVKNQGAYTISSGVATLLNVLNNAGGVKETGSLREIKIRRANGTIDAVDLYEFLITGKMDIKKSRILYGDYVLVPLKAKSVTIKGEVKRPGIYELIGNEGIKELIGFAGGLASNAYLKRIQIRRFEISAGEKFIDLDGESILNVPNQNFTLADGDRVTLFPNIVVRRRMVEIQGEGIKRPGVYQYSPEMTVKDLIEQAEGLKEDVYLERADLVRTAEDFSKKLTIFSLKELYKEESPGHYVYTGAEGKNFKLKEMDQIMTYSSYEIKGKDKYVTLEGHVKEPGRYILPDNMTLYDLVFSRGGFQDEDFKKRAYLELAHIFRKIPGELGESLVSFNLGKLLAGDPSENIKLEGEDRIFIYTYEAMKTKPFVTIEGLVKRPGVYDLSENMTLEDLILVAGGLRPDAYRVEAVIARTGRGKGGSEGEGKEAPARIATVVVPIKENFAVLPEAEKTRLEIYDKIVIRNLPEWEPLPVATVEGQVVYPGSYSLESREERISGIIRRCGGLKKEAFPEGAVLYRRKDIIEMTRERQEGSEKVAINLKEALNNPGGPYDLILKDDDRIYVPYNPGSVEVKGAVRNPSIFMYKKGKGLDYYIGLSGGYESNADKANLVVYLPNGMAAKEKGFLFWRSLEILPGSVVEVPLRGEEKEIKLVEVRGAVKSPTLIQYRKGEKLKYYVDLCGGYGENADIGNIIVHLPDGSVLEAKGSMMFNPAISAGSIVEVPFKPEKEEVKAGDVEVRGAVRNPSLIIFRKGEKLDYYVSFCGGYKENADVGNIVIHLVDKTKIERKGAPEFNPEVLPGSIIEVPFKIEKEKKGG